MVPLMIVQLAIAISIYGSETALARTLPDY